MKNIVLYYVFLLFLISPAISNSKSMEQSCDSSLIDILNSIKYENVDSKVTAWKKSKKSCDDDLYFIGLARIYLQAKQFDKVKVSINEIDKKKTNYKQQLEHTEADLKFVELAQNETITVDMLRDAYRAYLRLIKKYPDFFGGYQGAGGVTLSAGQYGKSIKYLEQSVKLYPSSVAYRNLTIAYYNVERYKDSTQAANSALALNQKVLSDQEMMLSVSVSHLMLGEIDYAIVTLRALVKRRPELIDNDDVVRLAARLEEERDNNPKN